MPKCSKTIAVIRKKTHLKQMSAHSVSRRPRIAHSARVLCHLRRLAAEIQRALFGNHGFGIGLLHIPRSCAMSCLDIMAKPRVDSSGSFRKDTRASPSMEIGGSARLAYY